MIFEAARTFLRGRSVGDESTAKLRWGKLEEENYSES
jgi:hypothetical protein